MDEDLVSSGNFQIVCQYKDYIQAFGVWFNRNPLDYAVPLILLQFSVISVTCLLIHSLLQPLGQSSQVSHIVAGMVLGPSLLGHEGFLGNILFPARSILALETVAAFGIMFFFFAIGIRVDPGPMVRPDKKSMAIGVSAMFITLFLTITLAFVLKLCFSMDDKLASALPLIAASQSLTAFPNISCLLVELKMSSSNIGRLAMSSSMFCDLLGMSLTAVSLAMLQSKRDPTKSFLSVFSALVLVLSLVYIVKPIMKMISKRLPSEKSLGEHYVVSFFTGNLLVGFLSEAIGQHFIFGPLVLGLMVPSGPPLGPALISKLDYFAGNFLYYTFLTVVGLKTSIFKVDFQSFWIVGFLIIVSCVCKVAAVLLSSRFWDVNIQDSIVLGLLLNARGACELIVFNLWFGAGVLSEQEFTLCVLSVVGVTAVITPLIKYLYDPYKQHLPLKRSTIQHMKRDTELRILVCIQNQETVPSIINLLEASNATEDSPIAVIAVLLVELVGRATPMLVAHHPRQTLQSNSFKSGHIINALRQYEFYNERRVNIKSFSAISQLQTMHDDIFGVALDQNVTIAILPFHRRWEIDGSIGSVSKGIQDMNIKIMQSAPCSVGILVDRGILNGSLSILNNQSIYHVCVIYIGGPDDVESLCYGARMARHPNVTLTVMRFLLFGCNSARERKLDNHLIDEVRSDNLGNENFMYQEQVVKDSVGLASSLRDLGNGFDLLVVGRSHQASPILAGLEAWSECPELGVLGDTLASPDFRSTSSVLVVQQQKILGQKLKDRMRQPIMGSRESSHESLASLDIKLEGNR